MILRVLVKPVDNNGKVDYQVWGKIEDKSYLFATFHAIPENESAPKTMAQDFASRLQAEKGYTLEVIS